MHGRIDDDPSAARVIEVLGEIDGIDGIDGRELTLVLSDGEITVDSSELS